jgi:predicted RNA-binding Zn-ribbon protein involved in translation (DUF1610 family)
MLTMLETVKQWAEPVKRGKRSFDDREFVESLAKQFKTKNSLSPRQIAALRKLLPKYAAQIPDYAKRSEQLGLQAKTEPKKTDAVCPECGAPLVQRNSRRGVFYGCSKYPKCKFTANELPGAKSAEA